MAACSADLRRLSAGLSSQNDVAQRIAQHLYACLADRESGVPNCALVRVYLMRPYAELDEEAQRCAHDVLGREPRSPGMQCLALVGTAGERPDWNDVSRSRRYRAMPLVSEQFIVRFPMFAQLLKEFGMAQLPVPEPRTNLLLDWEEKEDAVFYVPDAVGSPFVPGQEEFVIPCGIRSVLGFGGVLPSGNLFAVVLFSKVRIPQDTAELFKTLALTTKLALLRTDRVSGPPQSDPDSAREQTRRDASPALDLPTEVADLGRLRAELSAMQHLLAVQEETIVVQAGRMTRVLEDVGLRSNGRGAPVLTKQAEGTYDEENRILSPDSSVRRIRDRAFPIRNEAGAVYRVAGLAEDRTDRMEVEEELAKSLAQSRELSIRLEAVREQERSRIAQDLHDELGVALTCLKMDLARLIWLGGGGGSRDDRKQVEEKIRSMTEQVDLTLQSVQRLVTELRPGILDDLGLLAAVEWQCEDFAKRSGIACAFTGGGEEFEIGPLSVTALFRTCQEALMNVVRHAQATAVSVRLEKLNGYVSLTVQDNGVGIPQAKLEDPLSFGLLGMRERAYGLKGTLDITGSHGEGTTVTCRVPLN